MDVCVVTSQDTYRDLANAVQAGILEYFATILDNVEYCGEDHRNGRGGSGIVGIISFIGTVNWSLAISFPTDSAMAIGERFAGFEIPFEGEDMMDAVGELVNVLAGAVTRKLTESGLDAKMSLPSVARGDWFEVILPGHMTYRMHFNSDQGAFRAKLVAAQTAA